MERILIKIVINARKYIFQVNQKQFLSIKNISLKIFSLYNHFNNCYMKILPVKKKKKIKLFEKVDFTCRNLILFLYFINIFKKLLNNAISSNVVKMLLKYDANYFLNLLI